MSPLDLPLWAQIPIVFVASQYLVGPIAVRFLTKVPESYRLPILDADEVLAGSVLAKRRHAELERLGFVPAGATGVPRLRALLYVRPDEGSSATIMESSKGVWVSFAQQIGGTVLSVSNSTMPGVYPAWGRKDAYGLPAATETADLYRVFQVLRGRREGEWRRSSPETELSLTQDFANEELQHLVEIGFYSSRVQSGHRSVSLWAAFYMTWRMAWPVKSIRLWLARRRTFGAIAGTAAPAS